MNDNIRKMIKQIHQGKNLEENLLQYKNIAFGLYKVYSKLELAMGYYTLFEIVDEKLNSHVEDADDLFAIINEAVHDLIIETPSKECVEIQIDKLKKVRAEITRRMEVLTTHTDRFVVYEYVLNRLEYTCMDEKELTNQLGEIDLSAFITEILTFIFKTNDNSIITENIVEIINQLPIRMTKSKFFERVREGLSVYKDAEQSSLDDFLYMLKTASMLYKPDDFDHYYTHLKDVEETFIRADYKNINRQEFDQLTDLLEKAAKEIREVTDIYYWLQTITNKLYSAALSDLYSDDIRVKKEETCHQLIIKIWNSLHGNSSEEGFDELLVSLEGSVEECVETSSYLEAVLLEIMESHKDKLTELYVKEEYDALEDIANLMSNSLFMDLKSSKDEIIYVSDSYLQRKTEEFVEELSNLFQNTSRTVTRAVMAQILGKLPLMFQSAEEVNEYIRTALEQCTNKAEKYVSIKLLNEIMMED